MKGIHCAFEGRLGRDAEMKTTNAGRAFLVFSVIVGEDDDAVWLNVSAWSDHLTELAPSLLKGVEVYCQGKMRQRHWESDGGTKSGWQVSADVVQPKGLIGRAKPKAAVKPRGKAKVDSQAPIDRMTPKFDDPLPF